MYTLIGLPDSLLSSLEESSLYIVFMLKGDKVILYQRK